MKRTLLKLLRGDKSQAEMAKQYGITQAGWQSWETGRTIPPNTTMLKMEKDFDIPMEVIFFDSFDYKTKSNTLKSE